MFQYQRLIAAVGDDQKIFGRDDFGEALVGVPDEAFACPQHVEKLLGIVRRLIGQNRLPIPPAMMMQ